MVTISRHSRRARKRDKKRFWDSLQVQFGVSYVLILAAVLILLNTYPLFVSENMVFRSKESAMMSSVSVLVSSLSGLDHLNEENVSAAMPAPRRADRAVF